MNVVQYVTSAEHNEFIVRIDVDNFGMFWAKVFRPNVNLNFASHNFETLEDAVRWAENELEYTSYLVIKYLHR